MRKDKKELKSIDIIKEIEELNSEELFDIEGGIQDEGISALGCSACNCLFGNKNESGTTKA